MSFAEHAVRRTAVEHDSPCFFYTNDMYEILRCLLLLIVVACQGTFWSMFCCGLRQTPMGMMRSSTCRMRPPGMNSSVFAFQLLVASLNCLEAIVSWSEYDGRLSRYKQDEIAEFVRVLANDETTGEFCAQVFSLRFIPLFQNNLRSRLM